MERNFGSGFDRKRIINYNSDSYDCAICSSVPREPKEFVACSSIYCRSCIDQWIEQSNGVSKINCCQKYTITNLSEQLQRNYNNLQLRCLNCQQDLILIQLINMRQSVVQQNNVLISNLWEYNSIRQQ